MYSHFRFPSSESRHLNPISSMEITSLPFTSTFKKFFAPSLSSPSLHFHGARPSQVSSSCNSRKVSLFTKSSAFRSCVRASAVEVEPSLVMKNKAVEMSHELKGTSIFLVGMNSHMKTNLGKLLADVLRYYYFDSDGLVMQAAGGESAAKYLKESDEDGFQKSETEVLKQLSSMGRLVVCAGDSAVQSSTNLAYLRYGISVWVDVPLDMLVKEAMEFRDQSPSTLTLSDSDTFSEVQDKLTMMYNKLRGGYATADVTVSLQKVASQLGYEDMEIVTAEDMAMELLVEIEKLTRVKKMMEEAARPF